MSPVQMQDSPPSARTPRTVAELKSVSKCYGAVWALRNFDLSVHSGEVLALLGPNGAGKTTTVKLLLGLMKPSGGSVTLWGRRAGDPAVKLRTGAVMQGGRVPETIRVEEHIDLFSSYYAAPLPLDEVLALTGLTHLRKRPYGKLSGGEKQRLQFALAICGDPDLLFLDEPTVGMDVEARLLLWEQIRAMAARGKTVVLTTHYLDEVDALAHRVVVLQHGAAVAEGTPSALRARINGKRIRCTTRLHPEEIATYPGVGSVQRDRDAVFISASAAEPVLRELLARDPLISNIEVTSAGLEEAFLALTRGSNPSREIPPQERMSA